MSDKPTKQEPMSLRLWIVTGMLVGAFVGGLFADALYGVGQLPDYYVLIVCPLVLTALGGFGGAYVRYKISRVSRTIEQLSADTDAPHRGLKQDLNFVAAGFMFDMLKVLRWCIEIAKIS